MRIYDDIIVALLVMKPETMRHSTNSWLKIGTSVLARPACKAELGNADQNPNQQREHHQCCTYGCGQHAFSNAHSWAFSLFVAKPNIQFFPLISFCRYKDIKIIFGLNDNLQIIALLKNIKKSTKSVTLHYVDSWNESRLQEGRKRSQSKVLTFDNVAKEIHFDKCLTKCICNTFEINILVKTHFFKESL